MFWHTNPLGYFMKWQDKTQSTATIKISLKPFSDVPKVASISVFNLTASFHGFSWFLIGNPFLPAIQTTPLVAPPDFTLYEKPINNNLNVVVNVYKYNNI